MKRIEMNAQQVEAAILLLAARSELCRICGELASKRAIAARGMMLRDTRSGTFCCDEHVAEASEMERAVSSKGLKVHVFRVDGAELIGSLRGIVNRSLLEE